MEQPRIVPPLILVPTGEVIELDGKKRMLVRIERDINWETEEYFTYEPNKPPTKFRPQRKVAWYTL